MHGVMAWHFSKVELGAKPLKWWELKGAIHQKLGAGGERERERKKKEREREDRFKLIKLDFSVAS